MVKYWKTKNGEKVEISKMGDHHLLFALRLIEEAEKVWVPPSGWVHIGNGAIHYNNGVVDFVDDGNGRIWSSDYDFEETFDEDYTIVRNTDTLTVFPGKKYIRAFKSEIKKRGLKPLPLRPSREEIRSVKNTNSVGPKLGHDTDPGDCENY